ncbi:formate nitrite transporter [Klebsormidium nitens]|uniref:Formate nitrite transporter n=1 Tax=Klebsormidium nitens TaxID=105231 RepID=A0A1Y1I2M0_KLENI|nr:formate nitrite transporter [Klebsormidium nitens]|eukprot:GAQ84713.1 formate nitrite transporter [Klebsormidium nitens]
MAAVQVVRTSSVCGAVRNSSVSCRASPSGQPLPVPSYRPSAPALRSRFLSKPFLPSLAPSKLARASKSPTRASVDISTPFGTEITTGGGNGVQPTPVDSKGDLTPRTSQILDVPVPRVLNARQVYVAAAKLAVVKAKLTNLRIFLQAIVAGVFIALGGALFLTVGGACPTMQANNPGLHSFFKGLIGLPFGLTLCVFTGVELFTGNTMVMTAGWLDGRISFGQVMRNWLFSYTGNFFGSLLAVWAFSVAQILPHAASQATSIGLSVAKTSYPLATVFMRGILCNWMVCMAVWIAIASTDGVSKYVGMFLTISSFVALGFEHSVANMFIIPYGMLLGANVSWSQYLLGNLLPVSIGNIIGGAFCMAGVMGYFYSENLNKPKEA